MRIPLKAGPNASTNLYVFGSVSIQWLDDDGTHDFSYMPNWTPEQWKAALAERCEEIPVFKLILADVDDSWTAETFLDAVRNSSPESFSALLHTDGTEEGE